MTDQRSDLSRHKESVRKYLNIDRAQLGINEHMEESSAIGLDSTMLATLNQNSALDELIYAPVEYEVKTLEDFLGRVAVTLGDITYSAEDRKILRANHGTAYQELIDETNEVTNEADFKWDKNSLKKHLRFLDAIEGLMERGERFKPEVMRDELSVLQGMIRDYDSFSAVVSQDSENMDSQNYSFAAQLKAADAIGNYTKNAEPLPAYAAHLGHRISQALDNNESEAFKSVMNELAQLIIENDPDIRAGIARNDKSEFADMAEHFSRRSDPVRKLYTATLDLANELGIDIRSNRRSAN